MRSPVPAPSPLRALALTIVLALLVPATSGAGPLWEPLWVRFTEVESADAPRFIRGLEKRIKEGKLASITEMTEDGPSEVASRGDTIGLADLPIEALKVAWSVDCKGRLGNELDLLVPVRDRGTMPVTVICAGPKKLLLSWGDEPMTVPPFDGSHSDVFGVGPFVDGEARWTELERDIAALTLALLNERELSVLAGLPFVRMVSQAEGIGRSHAAYYSLEGNGDAAIVVLDQSFDAVDALFVGDPTAPLPGPAEIFAHEVGHAIARASLRDKVIATGALASETREGFAELQIAYAEYRAAADPLTAKTDEYNALRDEYMLFRRRHKRKKASGSEVTAMGEDLQARSAVIQADAEGVRVLLARYLELKVPQDALTAETTESSEAAHEEARRSALIEAFRELPGAKQGPTPYGKTDLDESFAEAFALFKVDPAALARFSPQMHDWFAAGEHLRWVEVAGDGSGEPSLAE